MSLLPVLQSLSPPLVPPSPEASSSTSTPAPSPHAVDFRILSHLLAHIFDNNYTILSIFASSSGTAEESVEKLGDLTLRRGHALPLLWAYLWGFDEPSIKGKAKASQHTEEDCAAGKYESDGSDRSRLTELTFRILLANVQASTANLFTLISCCPQLADFLVTRLYGPEPQRQYEVTFPPRDDWFVQDEWDVTPSETDWRAPPPVLRAVYLSLLKKLLEAGVTQRLTWRLFTLVKEPTSSPDQLGKAVNGAKAANDPSPTQAISADGERGDAETKRTRHRPKLTIPLETPASNFGIERLNLEALDLVRHGMKTRWPPTFVFQGGKGESEGGLEMPDMGRSWVTPQKGFNFSVSLSCEMLTDGAVLGVHHQVESSDNTLTPFSSWIESSSLSGPHPGKLPDRSFLLYPYPFTFN